jgi:hypothetical protein
LLLSAFHKIANRIASGLILAALIIGAALLMQVKDELHNSRLSRLRDALFSRCGRGGFYLVLTIFIRDHARREEGEGLGTVLWEDSPGAILQGQDFKERTCRSTLKVGSARFEGFEVLKCGLFSHKVKVKKVKSTVYKRF